MRSYFIHRYFTRRYFIYLLTAGCMLLMLAGCSAQARQMRQAKKYSRQNVKRQESKSASEMVVGPGEVGKNDINYKDLDKIRHRCLHINKDGERCGRKGLKKNGYKYCFWHVPKSRY